MSSYTRQNEMASQEQSNGSNKTPSDRLKQRQERIKCHDMAENQLIAYVSEADKTKLIILL